MRYTVRAGDTLTDICRRFRVDIDVVTRLNPTITHPSHSLRPGQVIILPALVVEDCPVSEPIIERFIPSGVHVTVRVVKLTRRRIPERVIIFRSRDSVHVTCGIIVIRFTCERGWHVIFTKKDIRLALRFMDTCCLFGDTREQVIIGAHVGATSDLCFCVLGCPDEHVRVFVDRLHKPVPQGRLWIDSNRIRIDSTTGQVFYGWNGTTLEESTR